MKNFRTWWKVTRAEDGGGKVAKRIRDGATTAASSWPRRSVYVAGKEGAGKKKGKRMGGRDEKMKQKKTKNWFLCGCDTSSGPREEQSGCENEVQGLVWVFERDRRRSVLFSPVRRNWTEFNTGESLPLVSPPESSRITAGSWKRPTYRICSCYFQHR